VETSLSFFSNNFKRALELGQDLVRQVRTGIGTIAPDFFDGIEDRKQVRNDLTSGFTVKYTGSVYPDDEHATDVSTMTGRFLPLTSLLRQIPILHRIPGFP